jgi:FAD/FMN-containing dehydrogenase
VNFDHQLDRLPAEKQWPQPEIVPMPDQIERTLRTLAGQLPGRVFKPGQDGYTAGTSIWAKPVGPLPRAVIHCVTSEDAQSAIRTARDCALPLSVRGGGHGWAGRALCGGIVIDLSGMNGGHVDADRRCVIISGGARAADLTAVTDPLHLAAATGTCSAVGMAGLTLGGGYGPLIGRFGLALDNLLAAQVVLADGRVVIADESNEPELFWALRGGGGNFGVVTAMRYRVRDLPSVRTGVLVYSFAEARAVLRHCADIAASSPEDLTVELGLVVGPDGEPVVMVHPTWCGLLADAEARMAPFLKLGTLLAGSLEAMSYGASLTLYDPYVVNGQRVFMDTCWLPALDSAGIDVFVEPMATAASPGCAVFTHEFKGAASRVPAEATAFGLRRDHVLVEILASYVDRSVKEEEQRHRRWAQATRQAFARIALPGGYPNFLTGDDPDRVEKSYGPNAGRLIAVKRHYDPDNIFNSANPLPRDC